MSGDSRIVAALLGLGNRLRSSDRAETFSHLHDRCESRDAAAASARLRARASALRLEAARIDGNTERALESGEADLAIGYVPWLSGGIYQQQLYQQDWVCLANRHHPRIHKRLGVKAYRTEGHVAITGGTGTALLEQALVRERIERQVVLELPGFLGRHCADHRSDHDLAAPYRRDAGAGQRSLGTSLPHSRRGLRRSATLARALPSGGRQSLAAFGRGPAVRHVWSGRYRLTICRFGIDVCGFIATIARTLAAGWAP